MRERGGKKIFLCPLPLLAPTMIGSFTNSAAWSTKFIRSEKQADRMVLLAPPNLLEVLVAFQPIELGSWVIQHVGLQNAIQRSEAHEGCKFFQPLKIVHFDLLQGLNALD
jgi:hypothetical protein